VTTKSPNGTGVVKVVAIVAGTDLAGIGVGDGTFTCTARLMRLSTTNPAVGDCPIHMLPVR
jgi:hypothetical protein